jgi:DNA-binding CsgD family transcriptional regulator
LLLVERLLAGTGPDGSALLLSGEPGVGKTALLRAAAGIAEARGFTVLTVQGVEFEAELTFAGLHQLLLGVDKYAPQLPYAQRSALDAAVGVSGSAAPDGLGVSAAVVALLRVAAKDKRLLVLVDDFQWLDRASARVLAFVARRMSSVPAILLCAVRDNADELLIGSGLTTHRLLPLGEKDASALLQSRYPSLAAPVRERLVQDADGNPLALLELPSALSSGQRIDVRELPHVLPLSDRLRAAFGARFLKLPASTRRIVLQGALAGSPQLTALEFGPGLERDLAALQIAEQQRVVQIDRGQMRLTFAHPLIRAAVVELSTAAEVRSAHLSLSSRQVNDPDRRAWHLAAAAIEADESVAALLEQTAIRNLHRGDTSSAIETMVRAAELSPDERERDTRLLRAAHLATSHAGTSVDLELLLSRVRADGGPGQSLYACATVVISSIVSGYCDVTAAHRMLSEMIRTHAGEYEAANTALMAAVDAMLTVCALAGRSDAWHEYLSVVDRLVPRPPHDTYLQRMLFVDPARVDAQALDELRSTIAGLSHEMEQWKILRLASAGIYVDALAGCIEPLLWVIQSGERDQIAVLAAPAMTCIGAHAFATGDWDKAEQWHERAIDLSIEQGIEIALHRDQYRRGQVSALRGNSETTQGFIDAIVEWATPRRAYGVLNDATHLQTLLAMSAGDYEAAYTAANAISPAGQFASCVPTAIEVSLDLVEACVHTGRQAEADAHVREMRRLGIARLSSRCALRVAGCSAIAAPKDEATTFFEIALSTPDAASWPYELARIQLAYGQHLRRNKGSVGDARRLLTAAHDGFDRLGAVPWTARAATELRASPANRTPRASSHLSVLTPQEREIAMLAATGLSNKEIGKRVYLSDRTVGAHLYHLYPKLGITSRAALRDALSNLDSP